MFQPPRAGDCLECVEDIEHLPRLMRVIAVNQSRGTAWLISLDHFAVKSDSIQRKRHRAAPFQVQLGELSGEMSARKIAEIKVVDPKSWSKTDAELRREYGEARRSSLPRKTNKKFTGKPDDEATAIWIRDKRYALIATLVKGRQIVEILDRKLLSKWIRENGLMTKRRLVHDAFNAYVAGNNNKNALLPDYDRCGARGSRRKQKKKIGRRNAQNRYDKTVQAGKIISVDDRELLQAGYEAFVRCDTTLQRAYDETMEVFYAKSRKFENGESTVVLLDASERPTLKQFSYWGRVLSGRRTEQLQTPDIEFLKNERPLPGKATDGIPGFGFKAVCDATPNDTHCVSLVNPLERVGVANRIVVDDMFFKYRLGFNISYEGNSARTALAAIENVVCDKVEFCARFGIDIKSEDWYSCLPLNFFGDNGEFNCAEVNRVLEGIHSGMERAPTGRADLKPVESTHRSDHARLDHLLPGTTHGRQRQRREQHPALDAKLNINAYVRLYIRRTLAHNNTDPVPQLLSSEMIVDKVRPFRRDILKWCIDNGLVAHNPYSAETLRALLLPELPAEITASGVFLIGKQHGSYDKVLRRARFFDDYLLDSGLMENARRNGNTRIMVRGRDTDLSCVWLQTKFDGLKRLKNVSDQDLLVREGSIQDLLALEDQLLRDSLQNQSQTDQNRVNESTFRQDEIERSTAAQQEAIALEPKKRTKKETISGITANRAAEIDRMRNEQKEQETISNDGEKTAEPVKEVGPLRESAVQKAMRIYREQRQQDAESE
jgi:putative transposase